MSYPVLAPSSTWWNPPGVNYDTPQGIAESVKRSSIIRIDIVDSYTTTGDETHSWDASELQDGGIMCYLVPAYYSGFYDDQFYYLIISGNGSGKIKANADSSALFSTKADGPQGWNFFRNTKYITGLNILDTSDVIDASYMFNCCSSLGSGDDTSLNALDLSSFSTDKVQNMSYMFMYCGGLSSLDVSNFNTSNVTNMSYMFAGCSGLTELNVLNFDISNVESISCMFMSCQSLTTLNLSNFDTQNVTNISNLFMNCSNLTNVDLSGFNVSKTTNLNNLFALCTSIENIDLSAWQINTIDEVSMGSMFSDCHNLQSITFGDGWKTDSVVDMGCMFNACNSLTSLDVSDWNVSNVVNFVSMFKDCAELQEIDVSNWITTSGENFEWMFYGCSNVSLLDLRTLDTSNAISVMQMFDGMDRLKYIFIGQNFSFDGNGTSVKANLPIPRGVNIPGAIGYWYNPNSWDSYIPEEISNLSTSSVMQLNADDYITYVAVNPYIPVIAAKDTWYAGSTDRSTITRIVFMNQYEPTGSEIESWNAGLDRSDSGVMDDTVVCYIDETTLIISGNGYGKIYANADASYMFSNTDTTESKYFSNVISIDNLNLLDTKETVTMDRFFLQCNAVQELDVSNFNTSSVNTMQNMFAMCNSLISLDLSKFDTSHVTSFYGMFANCSSLTDLNISNFKTSNVTTMVAMFQSCVSLTFVDLSSFSTYNVTNMMYAFKDCNALVGLKLSNKFTTQKVTTMQYMFYGCNHLEKLDLSSFDTHSVTDFRGMLTNTYRLKEITVSDKFKFTGATTSSSKQLNLDTPSDSYIAGADGNWYLHDGTSYSVFNIPDTLLENLAEEPTNPVAGQKYYNTEYGCSYEYDGVAYWNPININVTYYASYNLIENLEILLKNGTLLDIAESIRVVARTEDKYLPSQMSTTISGLADNYDAGYLQSTDDFWYNFTSHGTRTDYGRAFSYWYNEYIRPTIKIIPTRAGSLYMTFSAATYLKKVESAYFDFSQVPVGTSGNSGTYFTFAFCSNLEEIEDIGLLPNYTYDYAFYGCNKLHTIAKVTLDATTTLNHTFTNCNALENLTIEGEIGQSINLQYSTLLSKNSIISVVGSLSADATGKSLTLSSTAVNNAFTDTEWDALIADKTNWTISLK